MNLTSENGWPDLLVLGYDKVFMIEVKSPGEKPRKLQLFIHDKIKEFGHDVIVADNVEIVKDYIKSRKSK